ncbi:TonB-dependent receptor [Marinimicrobium sp. ARAG 43.8]|uniref:TonB-dependent receptor n=1 Tax=Marinimicrobium sp. ARAG 43.8 TaxID=3418719 RepID=UPI003CF51CD7
MQLNNKIRFRKKFIVSAVSSILAVGYGGAVQAQEQAEASDPGSLESIVVTGIRSSLQRAMDIKRDSSGVVDAISAEDIGAFPDTNLAESLQRITGVSIDRVNGEGSEVTIRGFGSGNNMVTLNGRQMPVSQVRNIGGGRQSLSAGGGSRAFDFSNLSSEGVSGLEVYKTGKANVVSGGLGGTVNISTLKPLDNPGLNVSVGAQALMDTSVESGDEVKPEINGIISWTDSEERFGVQLFGSFEERDSAARSATVNGWQILSADEFSNGSLTTADTRIENLPTDSSQLVARPQDSGYSISEFTRERINTHATVQFRPVDNLTLTGSALYVENDVTEQRVNQNNWFNTPFSRVVFDDSDIMPTAIFVEENLGTGNVKDAQFAQQLMAIEDSLEDYGVNVAWQVNDQLELSLDFHTGKSEALGGLPGNRTAVDFAFAAPVVTSQSADYRGRVPVQNIIVDDSVREGTNPNGGMDVGDLGSQVSNTFANSQKQELDQFSFDGEWTFSDNSRVQFGINYLETETTQTNFNDTLTLGGFGVSNPGDIPAGLVDTFCLTCQFDDFPSGASDSSRVSFIGNALALLDAVGPQYGNLEPASNTSDLIEEDIFAAYFLFQLEGELANRPARLTLGTRYEETDLTSTSNIGIPQRIIWTSDNDFLQELGAGGTQNFTVTNRYDNLLPNADLSIDITDKLVGRVSFSQTIGRPQFSNLTSRQSAGNPGRPTALDNEFPGGSAQNPNLTPLRSNNFDVSFEWYFGDDSMLSAGYYEKRIDDFIGNETVEQNLFGLRDVSSGAPGTRSGMALEAIQNIDGANLSDVNLFTMTALIDNFGLESALEQFNANFDPSGSGNANQAFVDATLAAYNVAPNADDPLYTFQVDQPINRRKANIDGIELAFQHFFWDSGFGIQLNYTTVNSDVNFDRSADQTVDQFALVGLSDTANAILMYEKHGVSARLAYNWRDQFLNSISGGTPTYTEDRAQLDLSVAYDVTDNLQITFEGINLTEEDNRQFARTERQLVFAQELDARFALGARYKF